MWPISQGSLPAGHADRWLSVLSPIGPSHLDNFKFCSHRNAQEAPARKREQKEHAREKGNSSLLSRLSPGTQRSQPWSGRSGLLSPFQRKARFSQSSPGLFPAHLAVPGRQADRHVPEPTGHSSPQLCGRSAIGHGGNTNQLPHREPVVRRLPLSFEVLVPQQPSCPFKPERRVLAPHSHKLTM